MAIHYTPVHWVDAPSQDTPIDATNLNHMDNGILAVANAYDTDIPAILAEIAQLRADIAELQSQLNS